MLIGPGELADGSTHGGLLDTGHDGQRPTRGAAARLSRVRTVLDRGDGVRVRHVCDHAGHPGARGRHAAPGWLLACSTRVAILTRSSSARVGSVVVVIGSPPPRPSRVPDLRGHDQQLAGKALGLIRQEPHAGTLALAQVDGRLAPDVLDRVNRHVLGLSCPVVEQAGASRLSGTRRSRPWHHWSSTNAAPGWPSPSTHQGCR